MASFISARGCVYSFNKGSSSKSGLYSIKPPIKGGPSSPVLLTAVTQTEEQIVLPTITVNSKNVLYVFGSNFGNVGINGVILLGPLGQDGAGQGLTGLLDWYSANKISPANTSTISISCPGGKTLVGYVTGLQIGQINPDNCVLPFSVTVIEAQPPQ